MDAETQKYKYFSKTPWVDIGPLGTTIQIFPSLYWFTEPPHAVHMRLLASYSPKNLRVGGRGSRKKAIQRGCELETQRQSFILFV